MNKIKVLLSILFNVLALQLPAQGTDILRFGLLPAESAIPIIVAYEKGFFTQQGVTVELTMFSSPLDRNVVLQGGRLDGAIADVMTALSFMEAGLSLRITSDINEDFKLLASPGSGITSMKALDGKDVSVVPNFALEYIMDKLAAKAGITYKLVNIPSIPARFEALMANRLSGVVFTEPQATLLVSRGAKLLGGSREAGLKAGALVFTQKYLVENPGKVKAFYRALNQAVDYINSNPADAYAPQVIKYGFPDVTSAYLGVTGQYKHAGSLSLEDFSEILTWTKAKGTIKKDWKAQDILDQKYFE